MDIKIEKDIPLSTINSKIIEYVFPFEDMEVGDSFFTKASTTLVHTKIIQYNTTYPRKHFKTRFWEKEGIKGRRVWRVEDK